MRGPTDTPIKVEEVKPTAQTRLLPSMETNELHKKWIARAFGMENFKEAERHEHRFEKIIKWATDKGAVEPEDMFIELRHLKKRMGNPSIYDVIVKIGLEEKAESLAMEQMEVKDKLAKLHG